MFGALGALAGRSSPHRPSRRHLDVVACCYAVMAGALMVEAGYVVLGAGPRRIPGEAGFSAGVLAVIGLVVARAGLRRCGPRRFLIAALAVALVAPVAALGLLLLERHFGH